MSFDEDTSNADVRRGYSSTLGRIRILSSAENARRTSYFLGEWLVFVVATASVTLLPLSGWWQARQANEDISNKKRY
jgi:hypothetical protein